MIVEAADNLWVIPPQRAVWAPSRVMHKISMHGQAEMRSLYVSDQLAPKLPEKSCVLHVLPFMRELLVQMALYSRQAIDHDEMERLVLITLDQLKRAREIRFNLPVATDDRLKKIGNALLAKPGSAYKYYLKKIL